jgi:hypothetical protein
MTELLVGLALFAFIVYLLVTYLPMPPLLKNVLIVIAAVLIVLRVLPLLNVRLP